MTHTWLKAITLFVLSSLIGAITACRSTETPWRPNVVVVLIDTLRADHLGFYGYPKEFASFLAALAEESAVFDRAFSTSSWTAPSTSSLFTSLYPNQHGVTKGFNMTRKRNARLEKEGRETIALNRIPANVTTLPERFKSMGYTTFGLASNPNIGEEMGFNRGFDQFDRDLNWTASDFFDKLKEWEGSIKQSQPFFLYLHLNDVHGPYEERAPYYEKQRGWLADRRARYLSQIGYTDDYLEKIYETMGLNEDTILVILSDHGEEFQDHGGLAHDASLYIELNRVVMMFHAPFLGVDPSRITVNVSLIDVLPTLLELVGSEPLEGTEGVSLVPVLMSGPGRDGLVERLTRRTLFAHRLGPDSPLPFWAAMRRHWKRIERPDGGIELYNHRADPRERRSLYAREPGRIADGLFRVLEEFKTREPVGSPSAIEVEVDEELRKTLETLGYVQ